MGRPACIHPALPRPPALVFRDTSSGNELKTQRLHSGRVDRFRHSIRPEQNTPFSSRPSSPARVFDKRLILPAPTSAQRHNRCDLSKATGAFSCPLPTMSSEDKNTGLLETC